jgi:hypothetical protein
LSASEIGLELSDFLIELLLLLMNMINSMDAREKSRSFVLVSSRHKRVPVFVMMPIDTFGIDASGCPKIKRLSFLKCFNVPDLYNLTWYEI